jgi:hypothetical protein
MFQTKAVEKNKTHILRSVTFFFSKIMLFRRKFGKYCRAGQATDEDMAPAHCMLNTEG